ncbi:MAG: universal stress protein [Saccharothrix sp.]|nr:universal stress protein [Saccharothrix sp.]
MTENSGPAHVVVGYDASPGAQRALSWAGDLARRTGVGIDVLMAVPEIQGRDEEKGQGRGQDLRAEAERLADIAVTGLTTGKPAVDAHVSVRAGDPADVLIEASARAGLIVVGRRGHGAVLDLLLGSVSLRVCAHAPAPVVVVPPQWEAARSRTVVVGVSDATDRPAVDFAAWYAHGTGGDVLAVHSWNLPVSGFSPDLMIPLVSDARDVSDMTAARDREIDDALAPARKQTPTLPIATSVVEGIPWRRLTHAAADAALLVVAAHRERGHFPLRIAPTVHAVLHHAPCPVAVIPVSDPL